MTTAVKWTRVKGAVPGYAIKAEDGRSIVIRGEAGCWTVRRSGGPEGWQGIVQRGDQWRSFLSLADAKAAGERALWPEPEADGSEGVSNLSEAITADAKAKAKAADARERLIEAVREAATLGVSESELAREVGVTRMTIRAWLGK